MTTARCGSRYIQPCYPSKQFDSVAFGIKWTVPSQITLPGGVVRTQTYDGLLRIKDFSVKDSGQSQVMSYQYAYDLTGNILAKATSSGSAAQALAETTNYGYDTLDRLTSAGYANGTQPNETYTYDPVANRVTDYRTTAAWTYNANNQLSQAGTVSYTYDDDGNTINQTDSASSANTRNYVYDLDNRLIEVRDANNVLIATYSYDPFGRRLSKDVGTQKTFYFYSAEGLVAEADANGQVTKSYGYAPGSMFTTNPLWMKSGTSYYYFQNDHLGTPQRLLNQGGQVVWSATYDAFGKAAVDASSTIANNLRFPGQYADQETGLHYNWMRYYDPLTGRYTTSDPIGLRGGININTYSNGNPTNLMDPEGKVFVPIITAGIGMIGGFYGAWASQVAAGRSNCIDWNSIYLSGLFGAINGAMLPFVGGGWLGAGVMGAVTNTAQTLTSNSLQTGNPVPAGGNGYPVMQAMITGAIGGAIGGAFSPVPGINQRIGALLSPSHYDRVMVSQASWSNFLRSFFGGAVSSASGDCGCP